MIGYGFLGFLSDTAATLLLIYFVIFSIFLVFNTVIKKKYKIPVLIEIGRKQSKSNTKDIDIARFSAKDLSEESFNKAAKYTKLKNKSDRILFIFTGIFMLFTIIIYATWM